MPEITFEKLEMIPEGLKEIAVEAEDKKSFTINVVPKSKVDEFRENNVKLAKERDELKATNAKLTSITGEDIDSFSASLEELKATSQKVKDGELTDKSAVEEAVNTRLDTLKAKHTSELAEKENVIATFKAKQEQFRIKENKRKVKDAITKAVLSEQSGAIPSAAEHIIRAGEDIFSVDDTGNLVAKVGGTVIYGADGASNMTPLEWMTGTLKKDSPYLFKTSSGGGGGGGSHLPKDQQYGGMSQEEFNKLPPHARLAMHNEGKLKA